MGLRPGANRVESTRETGEWLEPALRDLKSNVDGVWLRKVVMNGTKSHFLIQCVHCLLEELSYIVV